MKIGLQIEPQLGFTYEIVEQIAVSAEKLGYDGLWSSDHFFLDEKSESRNCMEVWTLLSALAVKTKTIHLRLGAILHCCGRDNVVSVAGHSREFLKRPCHPAIYGALWILGRCDLC